MLVLKVENFDRLGDGGPLHFEADRRGFDFGRDQHLDWTLPDPTRKISGKHCTVLFERGAYYLYDVSTNGTFVNGSGRRVQSPYELRHGDELAIGDYVVSVSIAGETKQAATVPQNAAAEPASGQGTSDIWSSNTNSIPPMARDDLMPQRLQPRSDDFLSNAAGPLPQVEPVANWDNAPAPVPRNDPWGAPSVPPRPVERALPPQAPPADDWPAPTPAPPANVSISNFVRDVPFPVPRPAAPVQQRPPPSPPQVVAGPSPEVLHAQFEQDILRRFAEGLNIPVALLGERKAGDLAFEMGESLRLVCSNLMQLLKARAEMKAMVRTSERTMIEPRENNSLKFTPTAEAALSIMFGQPSAGYLDPRGTLDNSFADLKAHEAATFSAMQQAVIQLLEELSPEAVEQAAGGNKLGFLGGKSRYWELFSERWKAKAGNSEHGMLDAFLDEFAVYYDAAIPKRRT